MSEIIINKLIKMEKYISELEEYKPQTYKEYKNDQLKRYAIERCFFNDSCIQQYKAQND